MKKIITYFSILFSLCLSINSCSDKLDLNLNDLSDLNVVLNNTRQDTVIQVSIPGEAKGWSAYSPTADLWCTFSKSESDGSLVITVDINNESDERESYILISGGGQRQRINIKQDRARTINLSAVSITMRGIENNKTVDITSSDIPGPFTVSVSEDFTSWLSATISDNQIVVSVKENPSTEQNREGIVEVSGNNSVTGELITVKIIVTQSPFGGFDYYFSLPEFTQSNVYKVMDGSKQIAQICKEYLRKTGSILAQAVVVYPMTQSGDVDLSQGYVAKILQYTEDNGDIDFDYKIPTAKIHGGTVAFDKTTNSISSYIPGTSDAATFIYMPTDDKMGNVEVSGSKLASLEPDMLTDIRGSETNKYPLIKIGSQYWMASNLNTLFYNKNKNFNAIPTGIASSSNLWKIGMPSVSVYGFDDAVSSDATNIRSKLGLLYSFLTISGAESFSEDNLFDDSGNMTDNLSPEGWSVPTISEYRSMLNYIGYGESSDRIRRLREFLDDQDAINNLSGIADEGISGFAARNGSYRSTNGSYAALNATNGAFFWSRTQNVNGANAQGINMSSLQSQQAVQRAFSIRCLKK